MTATTVTSYAGKIPSANTDDMQQPNVVRMAEVINTIEEIAYTTASVAKGDTVELLLIANRLEEIAVAMPNPAHPEREPQLTQ